jgi:hypothetical protein
MDDDCYVRPDYLGAVVGVFEETGAGFLGGRVVLHDSTDDPRVGTKDVELPVEIPPGASCRPASSTDATWP